MRSVTGERKAYLKLVSGTETIYWEKVGSVNAEYLEGYSYNVSTPSDSGPQGIPWYYFMVTARCSASMFWNSFPDSGYSVDNVPPGAVQSVAAQIETNMSVDVHWAKDVVDPDVGYYEVHRSTTSGFSPGASTKIGQTHDTLFVDGSPVGSAVNYYRVITVDIHGNQSSPSIQASTGNPLAIELTAFAAAAQPGNDVKVDWTTISETNNYGFYVQRRAEPVTQWTTVSPLIPGAGTSLAEHDYAWTDTNVAPGTYRYRLEQVDYAGGVWYSDPIKFDVTGVLGVGADKAPLTFELGQNYPNPFNPTTSIQYQLPHESFVHLSIYNMLGKEVRTLVNETEEPGYKSVELDGSNLTSGMYFYRITAGNFTEVKKMILIK